MIVGSQPKWVEATAPTSYWGKAVSKAFSRENEDEIEDAVGHPTRTMFLVKSYPIGGCGNPSFPLFPLHPHHPFSRVYFLPPSRYHRNDVVYPEYNEDYTDDTDDGGCICEFFH